MYYPKGVIASMGTCFDSSGALDLPGLGKNIEIQKKAGIKTICVLGGTGEAPSMSREERHAVMEDTMRHADGLHIVFGALAGTPADVKADIAKAKELGADAVMVMATPFVRPSERDVERLIREYATVGMPLIVFNTPSRSAFRMSAALVKRLNNIDEVVGIKESSGDMVLFQDIRVDCPHPFALLTGGDDLYLPSLALGGDGGILACAAVIPEVFVKMDEAIAAGDYETARRCHYAEKLLNDVMYKASHPVPMKLALAYRGLPAGPCRPPFTDLEESHKKEVYEAMGQLKKDISDIVAFVDEYSFV